MEGPPPPPSVPTNASLPAPPRGVKKQKHTIVLYLHVDVHVHLHVHATGHVQVHVQVHAIHVHGHAFVTRKRLLIVLYERVGGF